MHYIIVNFVCVGGGGGGGDREMVVQLCTVKFQ